MGKRVSLFSEASVVFICYIPSLEKKLCLSFWQSVLRFVLNSKPNESDICTATNKLPLVPQDQLLKASIKKENYLNFKDICKIFFSDFSGLIDWKLPGKKKSKYNALVSKARALLLCSYINSHFYPSFQIICSWSLLAVQSCLLLLCHTWSWCTIVQCWNGVVLV